jgi:AGCS family alanine or glycine:cation symporter
MACITVACLLADVRVRRIRRFRIIQPLGLLLLLLAPVCRAQGLDAQVNALLAPLSELFSSLVFYSVELLGVQLPLVVLWLVAGTLFCTLYLGFINLRGLPHALRLVRGDFSTPGDAGEVSHFQALATALSGTVGIGNIGGVAVAIAIGGPGAVFWMLVAGFLGMSTKFVECTLAVMFRQHNKDGSISGGPMYYLRDGLARRGLPRMGRLMGLLYAWGIVIGAMGIGNMFQSNQAFEQFVAATGGQEQSWFSDKGWLFGVVTAAVVGYVIIGGIRSIVKVTEKVVPFMAVLYVGLALLLILLNREALPFALQAIWDGAFTSTGVSGGALGAMIVGFQRAVFSNEAGLGSAAIAHSAVRTREPATEGYVALLEPFIDTIVICSLTALVIITTLYYQPGLTDIEGGVAMTSAAFERQLSWSPPLLAFAAMLFAFSTMISWSYYGLKGWTYIVGEKPGADLGFKLVFSIFAALGCMIQLEAVLSFSDAMVFLICVPNVLGIYLLAPLVRRELRAYRSRLQQPAAEPAQSAESAVPLAKLR